ncbi:unnamed protein product [Protopolystoma xenopodis]|uniref:Uncharacterized protein n=1 Tax=Protopolystoma xenopodis TaxID=117903 RepID=A0A448W9W6_9PLAT|nr:unnamed protein product [Protopolystoma xenopodis]
MKRTIAWDCRNSDNLPCSIGLAGSRAPVPRGRITSLLTAHSNRLIRINLFYPDFNGQNCEVARSHCPSAAANSLNGSSHMSLPVLSSEAVRRHTQSHRNKYICIVCMWVCVCMYTQMVMC